MFDELNPETFDERELKVLKFWREKNIFEKSVNERKANPLFSFYDGPPFATGLPHYGHFLAGTIKDVILRYKTMEGYFVPRRFGWDCHGLPIEQEIEKSFRLSGALAINEFGIANFNEECRKIVLRYTEEWKSLVERMGRWVDFGKTYKTMDKSYMESVWWVFKQLFEKKLVYEGYKVLPFSAKLGTPLSNFEAGENYKDVDDPSLTIAFQQIEHPNTYFLAWTTTPWTLVSNLALMMSPQIVYVEIQDKETGRHYILAKAALKTYYKDETSYQILRELKGDECEGIHYQPLLPYFGHLEKEGAFRIILDDSLSTEEGTGIVHCAPAFGEVDFYAAQRAGVPLVCPVDNNGQFTSEVPEYSGQFVKDADKEIIRRLKHEGKVIHHGTCHHRYPFCWRSDTPLIYKAVTTWFVAVEKLKPALLKANQQIHWTPGHIKEGRFGKWLEGARDWAISRNRYWGTPIPIWRAEDGELLVIGSIAELEQAANVKITDLHRHFIDDLVIEKNGKTFKRIPEVFDCWFESGSMPYAQNHYPFENQELFKDSFPADFIGEGLDQTRGWFYTLTILAAALYDKPAFKNVVVNGILLASDGTKMSKRLKNYPDPMEVVHKFGADAIRLYMMNSPAVKGDDLAFQENGVELTLRQVLLPLWNAYSFFLTYARIYNWKPSEQAFKPVQVIDRWMLSVLNKLIKDVKEGVDRYDLSTAVEPFVGFVEQLTNWYIRRSRRRFWEDENIEDRNQAFETLYHVLLNLVKVAAPFIPFITDAIYQNIRSPSMPDSVHLCLYPEYHPEGRDCDLEDAMQLVQVTVSLGHALRKENKLKVRQPLAKAHLISPNLRDLQFLEDQKHLIADELNVKSIDFCQDEKRFVSLSVKPDFRILGKKVGKLMREAQAAIDNLDQAQRSSLLAGQSVEISLAGNPFILAPEDVQVERSVKEGIIAANQNTVTIALDTSLTDELISEGFAREIVNKINTMRRDLNFNVTDRITITIEASEKIRLCFNDHDKYIMNEVLATSVSFAANDGTLWDLNGEPATITLTLSY